MPIFTVGHSVHPLDFFLDLLQRAGITAIADVRTSPFSRRQPRFSRPQLESSLSQHKIAYFFLGEQLGGRPADASLYDSDGRVDYERVRATALFQEGLDEFLREAKLFQIALLCAEEDPLDCHRALMIAPELVERGHEPIHLRKDGSLETTPKFEERLLAQTRLKTTAQPDLFGPETEADVRRRILAEAYRRRAAKKAYRREGPAVE